jgi:hypothetical protein
MSSSSPLDNPINVNNYIDLSAEIAAKFSLSFTFVDGERIRARAQAKTASFAPPDPFAACGMTREPSVARGRDERASV